LLRSPFSEPFNVVRIFLEKGSDFIQKVPLLTRRSISEGGFIE